MNEKQINETLLILQEECAEVTQSVSKIFRFGFDAVWPIDDWGKNNRQKLEDEIGDLLAMVDILVENGVISDGNLNQARINKKEKLKTWSNIYNDAE